MQSKSASRDILILIKRLDLSADNERFRRICRKGLLSSEEIIRILKLKPGPIVGEVIERVRKAQFERIIRTRKEALVFIEKYCPATDISDLEQP